MPKLLDYSILVSMWLLGSVRPGNKKSVSTGISSDGADRTVSTIFLGSSITTRNDSVLSTRESLAFMSTEVQRILKHGSNRRAAITLKGQDPQMTHRSKASQKALYFLTSEANTNIGFALNVASFSGSIVSEPWKYEVIWHTGHWKKRYSLSETRTRHELHCSLPQRPHLKSAS